MKIWKNLFGNGDKIKSTEIWHDGATLDNMIKGTLISANANLNDIKLLGFYSTGTSANTETLKNCPVPYASILEVMPSYDSGSRIQRLTVYNGSGMYVRAYYATDDTWYPWKQIY